MKSISDKKLNMAREDLDRARRLRRGVWAVHLRCCVRRNVLYRYKIIILYVILYLGSEYYNLQGLT